MKEKKFGISPVHRKPGIHFSRPRLKAADHVASVRKPVLPEDVDGRLGVLAALADEVHGAVPAARHVRHLAQGVPEPGKLLPQLVQRDVHGVGYGGDLEVVHRPHVQQQVRPAFVEQPLVFSAADPGVLWERVQAWRRLHYYRVRLKVFVRTED